MTTEIELREQTCATEGCGVTFWTTDRYDDRMKELHYAFHCPNGHVLRYPGKTDAQKLKEEKAEKARVLGNVAVLQHRVDELLKAEEARKAKRRAARKKA
jgi:hypothetical protein